MRRPSTRSRTDEWPTADRCLLEIVDPVGISFSRHIGHTRSNTDPQGESDEAANVRSGRPARCPYWNRRSAPEKPSGKAMMEVPR
jgi:hypothetical protein